MTSVINKDSKIAIIGAGIGGLSLAVALARSGAVNIRLFERRTQLSELGAGLQIGPNASRILSQLGFSEALERVAERFATGQLSEGKSGRKLSELPLDDLCYQKYGAHNYQLLRQDLHQILWDGLREAIQSDPVELGKELVGLSNLDSLPRLRFSDGTEEEADIVFGADGVRSVTRSFLFKNSEDVSPEAVYSGYFAWRGLVDADLLAENERITSMQVWAGKHKHIIAYPLAKGRLVNLVGVVESDTWPSESISQVAESEDWLNYYSGWDSRVLSLVGALESCQKWALHELPPLPTWSKGSVGLIGDAAHPMMPSLAQGAAQAMEDAVSLAGLVSAGSYHAKKLLDVYFEQRSVRVHRVQEASRWNLRFFHRREALLGRVENIGMRLGGGATTRLIARRYDWLYR